MANSGNPTAPQSAPGAGVSAQRTADFDERPPVPVGEYDAAARMVNVGYELVFELATALLRAHCPAPGTCCSPAPGAARRWQP